MRPRNPKHYLTTMRNLKQPLMIEKQVYCKQDGTQQDTMNGILGRKQTAQAQGTVK